MLKGAQEAATVLVVDDEPGICRALTGYLGSEGHRMIAASSAEEALEVAAAQSPDVAFVDLRLPGMDGMALLRQMRSLRPEVQVVLITAYGGVDAAIAASQAGACAYLPKPFDLEEASRLVRRAMSRSRIAVSPSDPSADRPWALALHGSSPAVAQLRERIGTAARRRAPVLFVGEVASGREPAARDLHSRLGERAGPFEPLRCSAPRPGEIEAMLDSLASPPDRVWFLTEIEDLDPTRAQRLLRDVPAAAGHPRVLASMRSPVEEEGAQPGSIARARTHGWEIVEIPPLRARREDLPALISVLLARINEGLVHPIRGVDPAAIGRLQAHDWPGNLMELENTVRAAALGAQGGVIGIETLRRLRPEQETP